MRADPCRLFPMRSHRLALISLWKWWEFWIRFESNICDVQVQYSRWVVTLPSNSKKEAKRTWLKTDAHMEKYCSDHENYQQNVPEVSPSRIFRVLVEFSRRFSKRNFSEVKILEVETSAKSGGLLRNRSSKFQTSDFHWNFKPKKSRSFKQPTFRWGSQPVIARRFGKLVAS